MTGPRPLATIGGVAVFDAGPVHPVARFPADSVVVSPDDTWLSASGGVSYALLNTAGRGIRKEMDAHVASAGGRLPLGTTVVTSGGATGAAALLHATVIDYEENRATSGPLLRDLLLRCLDHAVAITANRIVLPMLATGVAGVSPSDFGAALAGALTEHASAPTRLTEVGLLSLGLPPSAVQPLLAAAVNSEQTPWARVVETRIPEVAVVVRDLRPPPWDTPDLDRVTLAVRRGFEALRERVEAGSAQVLDMSPEAWERAAVLALAGLTDSEQEGQALLTAVLRHHRPGTGLVHAGERRLANVEVLRARYRLLASDLFNVEAGVLPLGRRPRASGELSRLEESARLVASAGAVKGGIGLAGLAGAPAVGLATAVAVPLASHWVLKTARKYLQKKATEPKPPRASPNPIRVNRSSAESVLEETSEPAPLPVPAETSMPDLHTSEVLGNTPVGALAALLADELREEEREALARDVARRDYKGSPEARLAEYLLDTSPDQVLSERFTAPRIRLIAANRLGVLDADGTEVDVCRRLILRELGFALLRDPIGLKTHLDAIRASHRRCCARPDRGRAEVVDAARSMERALKQLIRFHVSHGWDCTPDQLVHEHEWLPPTRSVGRSSLGGLVRIVHKLDARLTAGDGSEPARRHQREFGARSLRPEAPLSFVEYRNRATHDRAAEDQPVDGVLAPADAAQFFSDTLRWLEHLGQGPTPLFPSVVVVTGIEIDGWGRRRVRAVTDGGEQEELHTGASLEVGDLYFMHPRSNPIRVFPLLVPAS